MCFIVGFGLMLIIAGANVALSGDMPIGVITIVMGLWMLSIAWGMVRNSGGIDVSVENKIVAHDGSGRYLVKAKTSRQITGPRPHVTGNLPAGLYKVRDGLWIVDSTGGSEPDSKKIEWLPFDGNHRIEPRGNTETGGFLKDVMEGYDHDYIARNE